MHLLENDGYNVLASAQLRIIGPQDPLVRTDQRFYTPDAPISIIFEVSFNAKDWVGVYPVGVMPGDAPATLWLYVDGTESGNTPRFEGTLDFPQGLEAPGDYFAYLLENDGYTILARERFTVRPDAGTGPRVLLLSPAAGAVDVDPRIRFSATVTNGLSRLDPATVELTLDGEPVSPLVTPGENVFVVSYEQDELFAPGSSHAFVLSYQDDASPAQQYRHPVNFTVLSYRNIVLPEPIHFEDFDSTPEGTLPPGWTGQSFTDITNPVEDLANLDSATFARWIAIDAERFDGDFMTYSNPGSEAPVYRRVLSANPQNVVNGRVLDGPLAQGRFLFANSGYRNVSQDGLGQVLYLFTPDFNLSGHGDIHLSFHSLWEQNQDSIAAVEYSINQGQTWLPIVYMLHGPDILTMTDPDSGQTVVDAVATLTTERDDIALFYDDLLQLRGGYYGAFIGATISQDLAPYISARVDDNPVESKRVELFRLLTADHQPTVRFRFAHAGTDSWYFGVDNFGLYSIPDAVASPPLSFQREGNSLVISWPAEAGGFTLEQSSSVTGPDWSPTPGATGNTATVSIGDGTVFYRLRR